MARSRLRLMLATLALVSPWLFAGGCGARTELPVLEAERATPWNAPVSVWWKPLAPVGSRRRGERLLDKVDKVDLLLTIDNSTSMRDKEAILAKTVTDLVESLVNPPCVDGVTAQVTSQPAPDVACAPGSERDFQPITDLHVAVISSSLGAFGALPGEVCAGESGNDNAHLLGTRPRAAGLADPDGLLRYQPASPSEAASLLPTFTSRLERLIGANGENGCGFESTLEAWYRFLVDPEPWQEIVLGPCSHYPYKDCASTRGVDAALLASRRTFLRPDSLVLIVTLSDEDDCSLRTEDASLYPARVGRTLYAPMPRAAGICASTPNDPCCHSCLTPPPAGCKPDPSCTTARSPFYEVADARDNANLRCYRQKARFGVDFLYPVRRYVNARSARKLCRNEAAPDLDPRACRPEELVPNPLFFDLATGEALERTPDFVVLANIVGVPWQDLSAPQDARGRPIPTGALRYEPVQRFAELGLWDALLGDPELGIEPTEPLMSPSTEPRSGTSHTGAPLAPPSAGYLANPINGHEWDTHLGSLLDGARDLQFSCIFPTPAPRPCPPPPPDTTAETLSGSFCRCTPDKSGQLVTTDPVCQRSDGTYAPEERFAKALPGLRHLQVLLPLPSSSVLGSICPRNSTDPSAPDFGYRPTARAIMEVLL